MRRFENCRSTANLSSQTHGSPSSINSRGGSSQPRMADRSQTPMTVERADHPTETTENHQKKTVASTAHRHPRAGPVRVEHVHPSLLERATTVIPSLLLILSTVALRILVITGLFLSPLALAIQPVAIADQSVAESPVAGGQQLTMLTTLTGTQPPRIPVFTSTVAPSASQGPPPGEIPTYNTRITEPRANRLSEAALCPSVVTEPADAECTVPAQASADPALTDRQLIRNYQRYKLCPN